MNLFDIEGLLVTDCQGEVLYKKVFSKDTQLATRIAERVARDKDAISLFHDRVVMCKRLDEILLVIYSPMDVNEPFVGQVFEEFAAAFVTLIKTPTKERVWKKYDQIVLLVFEFLYEGIIMSGKSDEMIGRLPKRNFEGVDGMKVPRGFASLLHKATKSFSMGSNK